MRINFEMFIDLDLQYQNELLHYCFLRSLPGVEISCMSISYPTKTKPTSDTW